MSDTIWTKLKTYTTDMSTEAKAGFDAQAGHVSDLWNKVGQPDFKSEHVAAAGANLLKTAIESMAKGWKRTQKLVDEILST